MNQRIIRIRAAAMLALVGCGVAAGEEKVGLDKLVGHPEDFASWAYAWRADLAMQEKPEAYFSRGASIGWIRCTGWLTLHYRNRS